MTATLTPTDSRGHFHAFLRGPEAIPEQHEVTLAVGKPCTHAVMPGKRHGVRNGFLTCGNQVLARAGAYVQDVNERASPLLLAR